MGLSQSFGPRRLCIIIQPWSYFVNLGAGGKACAYSGTSWPQFPWVVFHRILHQGDQILFQPEVTSAGIQDGKASALSCPDTKVRLPAGGSSHWEDFICPTIRESDVNPAALRVLTYENGRYCYKQTANSIREIKQLWGGFLLCINKNSKRARGTGLFYPVMSML